MDISTLNYVNRFYDKTKDVVENGEGALIGNKVIIKQYDKYFVINKNQKEVNMDEGYDVLIDAIIQANHLAAEECKLMSIQNIIKLIKLKFKMFLYGKERFMDFSEVEEAFHYKKKQLEFQNSYCKE